MHIGLINAFLRSRILLGCESSKSFLEHVDLERVKRCDQHVNAQVELEPIYKQRICNILGNDVACLSFDFLSTANNFDATATGRRIRLHYIHVLEVF